MAPPPAPEPQDHELVRAAQSGDSAALETLLRRHYARLHTLCRRLCHNASDAEDAAQNALIAIARGLSRFDGRSSFSTWSYRVATNTCLDELRRRERRPLTRHNEDLSVELDLSARAEHGGVDRRDRASSEPVSPEQMVLDGERRDLIQAALDRLPVEFRTAVVLRDVADLDYAEIAELLELAPGTVRSRISRGRARLAVLLEDLDSGGTGNQTEVPDVETRDRP